MKLGLVISGCDPETVWNALRLANFALGQGDVNGGENRQRLGGRKRQRPKWYV
jgi:hypothetical protein